MMLNEETRNLHCYGCPACQLLPDPDPDDWFRDNDKRLYCNDLHLTIQRHLEYSEEWEAVRKPIYCPRIQENLNEEQKEKAVQALARDRENPYL